VPGIFSWPGTIGADVVSNEPAGIVDILPTVCGLLKFEKPAGVFLDGSDLAPLLTEGGTFTRHQPLFWHLQKSVPIIAMRDGDYNMVAERDYELPTDNMFREEWIPAIKAGGYKNFQLYNLKDDPAQTNDIAGDEPEVAARMRVRLLEISASVLADGEDWHLQ